MSEGEQTGYRIAKIELDERTVAKRSAEVEHERKVAIYDLLEQNSFTPLGEGGDPLDEGPYDLHLSIQDNRLLFNIGTEGNAELAEIGLPLQPFRRIVKEYFLICESYYDAIKSAAPQRIEAIDMGRRGVHDEGSDLLRDRLNGKITLDHNTARRLFTLLCVLHIRA